jgi:hypothetical protein
MPENSAISLDLILAEKRSRFDPLKDISPERLVCFLDEFRAGQLQNLARVMDAVEERDDILISVVPKTKAAVARNGWEVLTVDTDDEAQAALAQRQKEELEFFYNNLRATSALDQDELGGVSLLLRQMMDAKGKRYAVHNIVWLPKPGGHYTATFHHAPLWFFENCIGKMRFIRQPFGFYGEDMEPGAWLVTKGQGLMIACTVAWMFKRLPLRDWVIYSGRHGMPGIEGVTDAAKDSPEWKAVMEAVEAAYSEFKWVRNRTSEIKTIEFGTQGELPFPPLVERMDRALARIWRGGDLSTMSKDGQAVGANPQSDEAMNIEVDDCAWLSETLQLKVDRLVLDYIFGEDSPTLAYIKILSSKKQNVDQDLKVDEFAVKNGHPISKKQFAERYNRPLPDEGDDLLTAPAPTPTPGQPKPDGDLALNEDLQHAAVVKSIAADLEPVRAELSAILQISDDTLREVKLRAFLARIEQWKKEIPVASDTSRSLAGIIGSELASAVRPAAANAFDPGQSRDSLGKWVDENGGGLSDSDNLDRGNRAVDRAIRQKADVQKAMYRKEVGQIDFEYGRPGTSQPDANGTTHKDGYGISHIVAKHGEPAARKLPEVLARGKFHPHEQPDRRYVRHEGYQAVLEQRNSSKSYVITNFELNNTNHEHAK